MVKIIFLWLPQHLSENFQLPKSGRGQCSKPNGHLDFAAQPSLQCDYGALDCIRQHKHRNKLKKKIKHGK